MLQGSTPLDYLHKLLQSDVEDIRDKAADEHADKHAEDERGLYHPAHVLVTPRLRPIESDAVNRKVEELRLVPSDGQRESLML